MHWHNYIIAHPNANVHKRLRWATSYTFLAGGIKPTVILTIKVDNKNVHQCYNLEIPIFFPTYRNQNFDQEMHELAI